MVELYCKNCGGTLQPISEDICKCENCGCTYAQVTAKKQQELLDGFLNKQKQDKLNNLRRHLWQEVTAKFIDSSKIISICLDIKNIYPNDFLANFYEVACGKNTAQTTDFIDQIDVEENYDTIEQVVNFLIKSLKSEYLLSVNNLIERAYKGRDLQTYNRLTTAFASQAELVEEGVYEINIPRDVFVAYSSADMAYVQQAVTALEEQGITCFVAMRNLQHGAGAVDNYQHALESAMDNCKMVLFISSKNSRSLKCDAVKHELPYLKKSDLAKLSLKFPNVPYEKIDYRYKKPRIQWRIDDNKSLAVDRLIGEIFNGLEYCYSVDSVIERVGEYLFGESFEEEPSVVQKQLEEQNKLLQKQLEEQKEFLKKQAEEQEKRFKQQAEEQEKRFKEQAEEQKRLKEEIAKQALNSTKTNANSVSATSEKPALATTDDKKQEYTVGNIVKFGAYYQSDSKQKEPIEWKVLEVKDDKALLISKYALDCKRFNHTKTNVGFLASSLRTWLNESFLTTAFSKEEQAKLVANSSNDKVSLLSSVLAKKYFPSNDERICKPTSYAVINGGYRSEGACFWWLIDKADAFRAYDVAYTGSISSFGNDINLSNRCVRPIIWVNINSAEQTKEEKAQKEQEEQNITPVKSLKTACVGEFVQFGKYPINSADKKEDINWLVLDKKDGKLLVVSEHILDCKQFNDKQIDITWEKCSLRAWLNSTFMNKAFTAKQKEVIQTVVRVDSKFGGNATNDKMFLLDVNEANKYFANIEERKCKPTTYAKSKGIDVNEQYGTTSWWLSSLGGPLQSKKIIVSASCVNWAGYVHSDGYYVDYKDIGVRPAMWIQVEDTQPNKGATLSTAKKVDTETKTTTSKSLDESKKEPAKKSSSTTQAKALAQTAVKKEDDKYKKGAIITLGSYPQSSSTQKEPIEWKVIKKKDNKALLISKYVLDAKYFHSEQKDVTWENCTLRAWLNNEFFNTAFLDKEKEQIVTDTVEAHTNPNFKTSPGNPTKDKVFVLSLTEAETYLTSDRARACAPTRYAISRHVRWDTKDGNATWWLRTPGRADNRATQVSMMGFVLGGGVPVQGEPGFYMYTDGVRPAIWVYTDETREPVVSENTTKNLNLTKEVKVDSKKQPTIDAPKTLEKTQEVVTKQASVQTQPKNLVKVEEIKHVTNSVQASAINNNKVESASNYKIGDYIVFGNYPQLSEKTNEPIYWKVIDKRGSELLLITKYALDSIKFNENYTDTVWENCTLRTWLNNEFLNKAFSPEQIKGILVTNVHPEARPETSGAIGNTTQDKVFILSISEAERYFKSNAERGTTPTAYALKQGVYSYDGRCCYWLRNVGDRKVPDVYHGGHIDKNGYSIISTIPAVRPAIWVSGNAIKCGNLKSAEPALSSPTTSKVKSQPAEQKQPTKVVQKSKISLLDAKVGDIITFGSYSQSSASEKEPIEWIVLEKKLSKILVISKMGLINKKFNEKLTKVTWEDCSLRSWLNKQFVDSAFNAKELSQIETTSVYYEKLGLFKKKKAAGITQDKVFLLSVDEAEFHLTNNQKKCVPTAVAKKQGIYTDSVSGNCWWFLRTPGSEQKEVAIVFSDGKIRENGNSVDSNYGIVRPAMWIKY